MITVSKTKLEGVLLIQLGGFEDHRGEYVEIYNRKEYAGAGIDIDFVQDDYSVSSQNVLRGYMVIPRHGSLLRALPESSIWLLLIVVKIHLNLEGGNLFSFRTGITVKF